MSKKQTFSAKSRRGGSTVRKETEESTGWNQLGRLLLKMGQFAKAGEVYRVSLEHTTDDSEQVSIYYGLGMVKIMQREHTEAVTFYEKIIEIDQKRLPSNDRRFAISYNNIDVVSHSMGEYSKALSYYEKALEIQQNTLPLNHPDLGTSYNNIGVVYEYKSEYWKARSFYELAVDNGQHSLPPNLLQYRKNLDEIKKKL